MSPLTRSWFFPAIWDGWRRWSRADVVKQLTFGHASAAAARKALGRRVAEAGQSRANARPGWSGASGLCGGRSRSAVATFRSILARSAGFQRRVLKQCRLIPYGRTMSYGELAAKAGSPRAARAVGNCMAANNIPLLIPCHRVVCSDGRLGSFSAPGGTSMKRRLLAMESPRNWPRIA